MTIAPDAVSLSGLLGSLEALRGQAMREAAADGLIGAGEILHAECRTTISHTDHSLADLRHLDHPYAKRHGTIRIHKSRPWIVHTRSGAMREALLGSISGEGDVYEVWFDLGAAPHAAYVIGGTKFMLGRDPLWQTAEDTQVKRLMMRAFARAFGRKYRTQALLRFRPRVTSGGTVAPSGFHSRI